MVRVQSEDVCVVDLDREDKGYYVLLYRRNPCNE